MCHVPLSLGKKSLRGLDNTPYNYVLSRSLLSHTFQPWGYAQVNLNFDLNVLYGIDLNVFNVIINVAGSDVTIFDDVSSDSPRTEIFFPHRRGQRLR